MKLELIGLDEAATILRCLDYGEAATSAMEEENGTADLIRQNIASIRKRLVKQVYTAIIEGEVIDMADIS